VVTLGLIGALAACRAILDLTPPTPADAGLDASSPKDATVAPDVGSGDAAPLVDAGAEADAVAAPDTSVQGDTGPPADTGLVSDVAADMTTPPSDSGQDSGLVAYWSFSNGFDDGGFGPWDQPPAISTGAMTTVVTSGAHTGCCAMHATTPTGATQNAYIMETWTTATPSAPVVNSGTVAVRAWIKTSEVDPSSQEIGLVQGEQGPTWYAAAGLEGTGPALHWGFDENVPGFPDNASADASAGSAAEASYHCVEFVMNVGSAADGGGLAIFVDGVAQIQASWPTSVDVGWDSAGVGLWYSAGNAPSDVLVDDVTVALYHDQSPVIHIGCQ
jgi:hypothetical protein